MARKKDKRPFWTADCETDPFLHARVPKPFIWGLWTGATFHEFRTPEEFVAFVRDCDVIIYFHNGGKFDLHFLLAHINLEEPVKVINGRLVVAHIGKAELRDSWNLLPIPLAEYKKDDTDQIMKMLIASGVPVETAKRICKDYGFMEREYREQPNIMAVIRKYLRNDCLFLHELIAQFEAEYGRHLTQAGASMATWKTMSGYKAPETTRHYFQEFAKFYYGGRVQCFKKGVIEGPCNVYDIRSAYPWAMLHDHPYDPEFHIQERPSDYDETSMVVVDCVAHGSLPYRSERGAITFPDDNEPRRYYVPGHELTASIETATVSRLDIVRSIDFTGVRSFRQYIEHFYALRKEARLAGHRAIDIFCKLLMNSLYGKFGANPDNYGNFKCVNFQVFEDYCTDGYEFDGMIGPHALLRAPLEDWQSKFINVATAASITSQVRAKLWRAICNAEDVLYCDTDSIICRTADLDIGDNLGQWQFEGTADRVYIAGKKMYLCDGLFDKSGKPKMATKGSRLSPAQIKRLCAGETVLYEPAAPSFSLFRQRKPDEAYSEWERRQFVDRRIRMT